MNSCVSSEQYLPKRLRGILILSLILSAPANSQLGGKPGAFSRMGFGARGVGMGNALTAVTTGDLVGYYNPAALPFGQYRTAAASFAFLSLDRTLNFINYSQPLYPDAGLSAGIINAGVSDIDGRDSDGEPTGPLRTSENQLFLSFGLRLRSGFSLGINLKFYYYQLYTDVSSTTVGIDIGALVPVNESLTLGATIGDINSKYKWDTRAIFSDRGNSTVDQFPTLYTIGAAYKVSDSLLLISADLQASDQKTLTVRVGIEVPLVPEVTFRAGIDRIDLKEKGKGVNPTFGFTGRKGLGEWVPAVHYVFAMEPFSSSAMHMISLSVQF